jgi:hypothetical protein
MSYLSYLDICIRTNDAVVDAGQVKGAEWTHEASFYGSPMDIGVVERNGIFDEKLLRILGVVGIAVDQGFGEKTVLYVDDFIIVERDLEAMICVESTLGL